MIAAFIAGASLVALLSAPRAALAQARPARGENASLVAPCLVMAGAGHARCGRGSSPSRGGAVERPGFAELGGGYALYRLLGASDGPRRCRLQPTCSLFAVQATRRFGLLRGMLMGLARAQMSHSDQDGLLESAVASDGRLIFLDPVERWIHGAP